MVSTAWEVSHDDVYTVLAAHGLARTLDDDIIGRAHELVRGEHERVVEEASTYTNLDEQTDAANSVVEEILTERGVIADGRRLFPARSASQLWRTWREQLLGGYPNTEAHEDVRAAYARAVALMRDGISPPAFPHTSAAEEMREGLCELLELIGAARPCSEFAHDPNFTFVIETEQVKDLRAEHVLRGENASLEYDAFYTRRDERGRLVELRGVLGLDPRGWAFPATLKDAD